MREVFCFAGKQILTDRSSSPDLIIIRWRFITKQQMGRTCSVSGKSEDPSAVRFYI